MHYASTNDLPERVTNVLPSHARDIYKEAFNSAFDEYKHPADRNDDSDRETTTHKVAWSAVKKLYQKGAVDKWHRKK